MNNLHMTVRWFALAFLGALIACSRGASVSTAPLDEAALASGGGGGATGATVRVRCERRTSANRSKISVDGNNLVPRNRTFSARVRAAGGAVTSSATRAVGDEAEFAFDSNANDLAQGATRIQAGFIVARSGPDVIGEILKAQSQVIANSGCGVPVPPIAADVIAHC